MEKFKFLDHPTDLKIQAFGTTEEELFTTAALGLMNFLYPKHVSIEDYETKEKIRIKSSNLKALMVDWLSELLYLSDDRDVCYNRFDFDKATETEIVAVAFGRRVRSKENIKAVTYNDLAIEHIGGRWKATIRFELKSR